MAWISTDQGSPSTRFTQWPARYNLTSGVKLADDWADLTDGTIDTSFNKTETNGTPPIASLSCSNTNRMTWTGTNANGTPTAETCSNFSSTQATGAVGRNTTMDMTWSVCDPIAACTNTAPLYCFQQ
jgi:hypothetical protein